MIYDKSKRAQDVAEDLFIDFYDRQQKQGHSFFTPDGSAYVFKDLRSKADPKNRELWEAGFDIDFCISCQGRTEIHDIYHEVKSYSRTLNSCTGRVYTELTQYGKEQYQLIERGVIPLEIVSKTFGILEGHYKTYTVPGTDRQTETLYGTGCFFKNTGIWDEESQQEKNGQRANWFHFYLPMGDNNEGRKQAEDSEIQAIQKQEAPGTKIITEAPAGLYISMTEDVLHQYLLIALDILGTYDYNVSLQKRREILEEYPTNEEKIKAGKEGRQPDKDGAKYVRVPVIRLLEAQAIAEKTHQGLARLEVRPVFKFIRNKAGAEDEIEVANDTDYVMPKDLKNRYLYFNKEGQLKHTIPGYWDDAPVAAANGKHLLDELIIRCIMPIKAV